MLLQPHVMDADSGVVAPLADLVPQHFAPLQPDTAGTTVVPALQGAVTNS